MGALHSSAVSHEVVRSLSSSSTFNPPVSHRPPSSTWSTQVHPPPIWSEVGPPLFVCRPLPRGQDVRHRHRRPARLLGLRPGCQVRLRSRCVFRGTELYLQAQVYVQAVLRVSLQAGRSRGATGGMPEILRFHVY